ncbi:alpha/beta fold hydrolase [Cystobacter ferrugineus]|uniref:Alpha/beta hydrolase n=1 Tax=Cystobacter ferrugineus TaxID=83449 RepID=A0A1L9AXA6_9BACT|nr:alpha/beta fold hydrolase [Cystobacter ferrugineus]OJH34637.1 alpha/beta hydrolase [Cystobacter ferrugineus]
MNTGVLPPERQSSLRLSDGRTLAWSEWGPTEGLPVLFCTGAAMSGSLGFGASDLAALGSRLIAIDRPGLGASDAHPGKTLASWVEDTRQLLSALGSPRDVTAVGFSQGAPFALALAGRELVKAVAIVSGQDDLAWPALAHRLHPDVAAMVRAARQDPEGFEQSFAGMATADGLWQLILGMSGERDRALYQSEPFGTAYQRCLREGFSQGARGYARDLVNALGPWLVEPERISVKVDLWYGGQDTSTVHSPDFGVSLAARLPNATLTVDSHEGGSILWTRARDILARLESHVSGSTSGKR